MSGSASEMMRFIDTCAPRPYASPGDLAGLGGTEATLLRIARGLAGNAGAGSIIRVEQSAREATDVLDGVTFAPLDLNARAGRTIVVINSWKVALSVARRNPDASVFVWQHVVPGRHNRPLAADLVTAGIGLICVSHSLAAMVRTLVGPVPLTLHVIWNPIGADLAPDATPRDPDLLFFASSPHKGLDQVLTAFAALRPRFPGLRLELADPGYLAWPVGPLPDGVTRLGALTHPQVIARMRRALCLFYPQTRFAETFGLVIAEANAVGCPALLHRGLGANNEVASDPTQLVDGSDPDQIAGRVLAWRQAHPQVRMRDEFRLPNVLEAWRGLLSDQAQADAAPVRLSA